MIGDQNLEFDHGRAFWKPDVAEVLTSTGSAVPLTGSTVSLPYVPMKKTSTRMHGSAARC